MSEKGACEKLPFDYWTEDIRKNGVPWPRLGEWFGDDEVTWDATVRLCATRGIELRYFTDEIPDSIVENGEALEAKHLAMIGRPPYDGKDGWKMIGAFDTEDGEIALMYARPMEART